jgi:hypothetical protein
MDSITTSVIENFSYRDIAAEVKDHLDEPDAIALAEELLTSFNYDSPCHTGSLYIKSVEAIIEGYMKKQSVTIVDGVEVINRSFSIKEIVETLNSLNYTEYNKNMIITSLALIK